MTCPRCGKHTPADAFCSIECMKLYKGKKYNEKEQYKERYKMLDELTDDFSICPFCQIKLKESKPKQSKNNSKLLEKNKYCPRCYRVFGHLTGKNEEEEFTFKKVIFEEAQQILHDLQDIIPTDEKKI